MSLATAMLVGTVVANDRKAFKNAELAAKKAYFEALERAFYHGPGV